MVRLAHLLLVVSFLGLLGGEARASSRCDGPLALLIDRSGSMRDHDPGGELRRGVAAGLDAARPAADGDVVAGFDERLAEPRSAPSAEPAGWSAATDGVLMDGDSGATELAPVLSSASALPVRGLIVLTDAEAALPAAVETDMPIAAFISVGSTGPAAGVAERVRAMGGRALGVRTMDDARRAGAAVCAELAAQPPAARDVVLVAGLRERTATLRGVRAAGQCAPSGDLAGWCRAFAGAGWRVWVPSTAPRRRGGAVLDSTGPLDANARAFAAWLQAGPGTGAVLVGHSMGGLIAHAALSRGALAAGLVTVGTPHAGSFGADAYLAALAAARGCVVVCPVTGGALRLAALGVHRRFGDALIDLTRQQRTHGARLGQPPVPLAVWAGTPNALPDRLALGRAARDDYLMPNDGIVGRGSATGALAGLAPVASVIDGAARHSRSVPPRSAVTELGSTDVAAWVLAQAERFAGGTAARNGRVAQHSAWSRRSPRELTSRRPAATAAEKSISRHARRRRVVVELQPVAPLAAGDARTVPAGSAAVIVATAPIGVLCDGEPTAPLEVAPGLWYLDVGTLGCGRIGMASPSAAPLLAAPSDAGGVLLGAGAAPTADGSERVSIERRARGGWRLRLSAARGRSPHVTRGTRSVAMVPSRAAGEWSVRRWRASLPLAGARHVSIRVDGAGAAPRVAAVGLP